MPDPIPQRLPFSPRSAAPWVVLFGTLALTAGFTAYLAREVALNDRIRFDAACKEAKSQIETRIGTYVDALRSVASFCSTDYPPTDEKFTRFAQGLALHEYYPGIQGIGFSFRLVASDAEFEGHMQRKGHTGFRISPRSPEQDERHAVIFLYPLDARNRAALGFDMYSEPVRRAAMQRARDTGAPAASGKVTLKQEIDADVQPGFLIYLPVYYYGRTPATMPADERRSDLLGFVYAPFRGDDLFRGIFAVGREPWLDVRVYDGDDTNPDALLHHPGLIGGRLPADYTPAYTSTDSIVVADRRWTLAFATRPGFRQTVGQRLLPLVAVGGVVMALALFIVTRAQARARGRAEAIATDLAASERALRVSESRFRRLSESNLIGIFFADLDGRIHDGNDAYFNIIGYPRADVLAGRVRWDRITAPEYADADRKSGEEIRATGRCEPFEKEFIRPDGSRVPVMIGGALLEGSDRECVAFVIDLTHLKRVQEDLRGAIVAAEEARQQAETANRLKDEFLATLSHELRTPLNAILGWAQLLRGGLRDPEDLEQGLTTIDRNARVQAQLIDDLLDISRIIAGKLRLEPRDVEPRAVVDAAIASVRLAAEAKGVQIVHAHASSTPSCLVWGDPGRLQQAVWNLLSNAIKFTPKGGRVTVTIACDASHVRVAVADTGKGIDRDFLPYVFERFRQADGSVTRKYGGLGLGLAIVKNLVELHGGSIAVESPGEGRGATFTVSLPIKQPTAPHGAAPNASSATGATPNSTADRTPDSPHSLAGLRALVVDDDADARTLLVRMLKAHDAEVEAAASGQAALAILQRPSSRFDVILADIAMPEMDGYDFLVRVRALPAYSGNGHRHPPAIAITAFARPEDRARTADAGFALHLSKPVNPISLCTAVREVAARAG